MAFLDKDMGQSYARPGALPQPGVRVAPQAPKPAKVGIAPAQPSADELNKQYTQQGFGPGTTDAQVREAKGQRNAAVAYSGQPAESAAPVANVPQVAAQVPAPRSAQVAQVGLHNPASAPSGQVGVRQSASYADPSRPDPIYNQLLRQHQELSGGLHSMYGGDFAAHQAAVANSAAALQGYRANESAIAKNDGIGQLARLGQLGPREQALYIAGQGGDPRIAGSLPHNPTPGQSQFNAANYADAGQTNPELANPAAVLASDSPIHEKAAMFAGFPGINNPDSPHRQLWDAFMANQQARGSAFDHELGQYNPLDPEHGQVYDTSTPVAALGSIFGSAKDGLFGVNPAIQKRNQRFSQDMGRLGYAPASANDVRAKIGVKPADY